MAKGGVSFLDQDAQSDTSLAEGGKTPHVRESSSSVGRDSAESFLQPPVLFFRLDYIATGASTGLVRVLFADKRVHPDPVHPDVCNIVRIVEVGNEQNLEPRSGMGNANEMNFRITEESDDKMYIELPEPGGLTADKLYVLYVMLGFLKTPVLL